MELAILPLPFTVGETNDVLYSVLLRSGSEALLVDCGYPGFLPLLEQAARQQKSSLQDLTGIIITHHDLDHVGALAELKAAYPTLTVYASDVEAPYISGQRKSARLEQAEALFDCLPEDQKPWALGFQEQLRSIRPVAVDVTFPTDRDSPFVDDLLVLPTPGHMPGHISLYLAESKTLVAADALVFENGRFDIANPQFTLDLPRALASVRKLQRYELSRVVCYHGGVVEGDIPARLQELLDRYTAQ